MRYLLLAAVVLIGFTGYAVLSVKAEDPKPAEAAAEVPVAAVGSDSKPLKISVVDIDRLLSTAKAAKAIQAQVDEKRKGFLAEVEKAEKELRESQKAIEKESKSLSREELMKKAQGFEAKRLEARKGIQEKKNKLDKAYTEAMNSLTKAIYEVCQKIADEKKIDLVITRQNIIVGSMALDITPDVLKGIDATLQTLELKVK